MKKYKILTITFHILSIILLCAMCIVVSSCFASYVCAIKHNGMSAPADVALLYAIPFIIAIAITSTLTIVFYKKYKKTTSK